MRKQQASEQTKSVLLALVKRYHEERKNKTRVPMQKTLDVFMSRVEDDLNALGLTLEGLE